MRKLFVLVILLLSVQLLAAQKMVIVSHEVAIIVPDECEDSYDENRLLLVFSGEDYTCFVKFLPFNYGFGTLDSEWKKKRKLDTLVFEDLRNATLIKNERNSLLEFDKDYMKKTYFDNGVYNVTYTTRTVDGMYLFRFTTDAESMLSVFDEILGSVIHERGNLIKRTQLAFVRSPFLFLVLMEIGIMCAFFLHRRGRFLRNLMIEFIIFVPVAVFIGWGFRWDVELVVGPLIIAFILLFLSCVTGRYITVGW